MGAIADGGRVEAHVRRNRFQTRLQVEKRRQSVGCLSHVSAVPAVFVDGRCLHDMSVDAEHGLVDACPRVRRAEDQIARALQGLLGREGTGRVAHALLPGCLLNGANRDRTGDLLLAKHVRR